MKLIGFVVNFLCIWLLGMNLASAEKFSLDELSNYFNKLDTFQANFRQFSDDGSEAKGVILIKKPGRLRIDYEEPEDLLILGSGGRLAIFDPKGDPEPTSFPLNLTPFSLVLENSINFVGSSARSIRPHRKLYLRRLHFHQVQAPYLCHQLFPHQVHR